MRTLAYTTARVWGYLYFYDKLNKDPRRQPRIDGYVFSGVLGGVVTGILTNPVDTVFARMQVDDCYPVQARRNYKNFLDGLYKVTEEGALFRGAIANGLKIGLLLGTMTGIHDLCKENSYYFLGPSTINRFFGTAAACLVGTAVSMPFDMIRLRL
jgi:dicarboxylate transporter 10